ncbi:MAG: MurR/RpiR family transcriptional regulator [Acutalibacter sp.]|jgi:DNA-binding MurR/RpiR family transcriptional regulator
MIYGKMPVLFLSAVFSEKNGSINNTVAQYILEHQELVRDMGITELADACHVSPSSISRFCKEIGLDNFAELRELMQTNQMVFDHSPSPSGTRQGIRATVQKITDSIHMAGKTVNPQKLRQLCQEIDRFPKVAAFGLLKAETAAISLQCDLLMQGKQLFTQVSYPQQLEYIQSATQEDLILIFSCTGSYFEYQDFRSKQEALQRPRIWMITGVDKKYPPFIDETLSYAAGHGQAGHPYQLLTIASLIAQEFAEYTESKKKSLL